MRTKKKENKPKYHSSFRILSLEASDIFSYLYQRDEEKAHRGVVADKDDHLGDLDASLDTMFLEDEILRRNGNNNPNELSFEEHEGNCFLNVIINVSFTKVFKEFNKMSMPNGQAYIRAGYRVAPKEEDPIFPALRDDHISFDENGGVQAIAVPYKNKKKEPLLKEEETDRESSQEYLQGETLNREESAAYSGLSKEIMDRWKTLPGTEKAKQYFEIGNKGNVFYFKIKKEDKDGINPEKDYATGKDMVAAYLREYLYEHGFDCNNHHYVRYKRSAGSAKDGQCLFIREDYYAEMIRWSSANLNREKISEKQLTEWEAYSALTLSGIMSDVDGNLLTVKIAPENILIIPDAYSIFYDTDSIEVEKDGGKGKEQGLIVSDKTEVKIENAIWDGQSLLDFESLALLPGNSVFQDNRCPKKALHQKGMVLLRNRFFKSCAFNTNLQQWFADNGVTDVKDLAGYTRAKRIKDILLVVTPSSIKYMKLAKVASEEDNHAKDGRNDRDPIRKMLGYQWAQRWLDTLDADNCRFGIVKTDKKTSYMDGLLVSTNYQVINTVGFPWESAEDFLRPSFDYLLGIQSDPLLLKHYLKMNSNFSSSQAFTEMESYSSNMGEEDTDSTTEEDFGSSLQFTLVSDIMETNEDFFYTVLAREFLYDLADNFRKKLRRGKVLVNGTYATLFGNPAEMLMATLRKSVIVPSSHGQKKEEQKSCFLICDNQREHKKHKEHEMLIQDDYKSDHLSGDDIYISRFDENVQLLCARSPHITMGNLMKVRNRRVRFIDKYFNLSPEIVCVNSIKNNIMQRLNGCDFDSDTMLITDNRYMLDFAWPLAVPVKAEGKSSEQSYSTGGKGLSELDDTISHNAIGKITNLSQYLNSIFWTMHHREDDLGLGQSKEELYKSICILAVLSGTEIDRAKRVYLESPGATVKRIRCDWVKKYEAQYRYPFFLKEITSGKQSQNGEKNGEKPDICETAMAYFFKAVQANGAESQRTKRKVGTKTLWNLLGFSDDELGKMSCEEPERLDELMDICRNTDREISRLNQLAEYVPKNDTSKKNQFTEEKQKVFTTCREDMKEYLTDRETTLYICHALDSIKKSKKTSREEQFSKYKWYILLGLMSKGSWFRNKLEENASQVPQRRLSIIDPANSSSQAQYTIYGYDFEVKE